MAGPVHYFGIRHHGPGCARSLLAALRALQPDCVLVEGPAGCEPLLAFVADPELVPPVALLSHAVDDPANAVFHPYAEFSPEWQALRWAAQANVPARFIDVPPAVTLAWCKEPAPVVETETVGADDETSDAPLPADPLDWLAHAAGFSDGEGWWNHLIEERGDGEGLFEAIAEAMQELRGTPGLHTPRDAEREEVREAHMRTAIRAAQAEGFVRIAVVCGAWHVPALAGKVSAAADARTLKGLDKVKAQTTWVPWTNRHLAMRSGYGAGVASPGWYEHLWHAGAGELRAAGWFARVARLLREHELDCSSAHLIEASRLADTLAALRGRAAPGLEDIDEATRSVICYGEDAPMQLIAARLRLGDAMGTVPSSVPTVPLQRDLEAQQKTLRLKPEALTRTLDLDLRKDIDLQRSHLLHRLALLGIPWGALSRAGRSAKGTFHEIWDLAWEPRFSVDLIVASRFGHTLEFAACAAAAEQASAAKRLADLAALIDRVLLADLPGAVEAVGQELAARAATDADPLALLEALPALANIHRYGNVRRTDAGQVARLFDGLLLRAGLGLPLALADLDEEAADKARGTVLAADRAVALRQDEDSTTAWRRALGVVAGASTGTPLLRGTCTRLLLDADEWTVEVAGEHLARNLSPGADPLPAAQWLEGFLDRNAAVLLHGEVIWNLVDDWLASLPDEHFVRIVPLVRRAFARFEASERRDLGARVRQGRGASSAPATAAPDWMDGRALRALPLLRELLGIGND